ncbi:MAG: hypothetical protein QF412_00295 [Planctomycetota bacterium]|jgi:hypothetical protein|nr:hypothetical protein [Planctomycetota bacterium]
MKLTPLEQRQADAMSLASNLLSAKAIAALIEHDQRINEAVEKRNRLEQEGLLFDPLPTNLLIMQLETERKQIEELFLAAGTFHEDRGISA